MAQTLTLCSVRLPRIPSSPRHLNKGLVVIGWRTCVWELPVWLALAPLRYRCWSLGSAAVTYPDIRLGWLLPVSSSLLIWDYIPCVLSIYGMNWVPTSMLTFLPELSFDNIIRKNCSLEYPDHKSENIKFYINPLIISSGCMKSILQVTCISISDVCMQSFSFNLVYVQYFNSSLKGWNEDNLD